MPPATNKEDRAIARAIELVKNVLTKAGIESKFYGVVEIEFAMQRGLITNIHIGHKHRAAFRVEE